MTRDLPAGRRGSPHLRMALRPPPSAVAVARHAAAWERAQAERAEAELRGVALMAERQVDYGMAAD